MTIEDRIKEQTELARELGRAEIAELFAKWIMQRPGLDPRNYCKDEKDVDGLRAYRNEANRISKDRAAALRELWPLSYDWTEFDPQAMGEALALAFSGRLTLRKSADGTIAFTYTSGQYWPTEYRPAAKAVLSYYKQRQYDRL